MTVGAKRRRWWGFRSGSCAGDNGSSIHRVWLAAPSSVQKTRHVNEHYKLPVHPRIGYSCFLRPCRGPAYAGAASGDGGGPRFKTVTMKPAAISGANFAAVGTARSRRIRGLRARKLILLRLWVDEYDRVWSLTLLFLIIVVLVEL